MSSFPLSFRVHPIKVYKMWLKRILFATAGSSIVRKYIQRTCKSDHLTTYSHNTKSINLSTIACGMISHYVPIKRSSAFLVDMLTEQLRSSRNYIVSKCICRQMIKLMHRMHFQQHNSVFFSWKILSFNTGNLFTHIRFPPINLKPKVKIRKLMLLTFQYLISLPYQK
jgi:hypothetical protein